jgi:methylenetetrahydrofolate dehydrogenase (NADP+)/methenyltetrahydrofolate cyclohydrolase
LSAKILNGEEIARHLRLKISHEIQHRTSQGLRAPTLAVILVGNNSASKIYVRNKRTACNEVGITAVDYDLPATTSELDLLTLINKLNHDPKVDGILVQLPLPKQINPNDIFESINPHKDVDGFHPYNLGRLAQGRPYLRPCTPAGIMHLLEHTKEKLEGKTATVVGTSLIVGLPMILELMRSGVTVTACHKKTADLKHAVQKADIIIVATGNPELIKGEWIKPGCIAIDVGMNRLKTGGLVGDLEFHVAKERASWITPVPGGVGPMTIASLLNNTLLANLNCQLTE